MVRAKACPQASRGRHQGVAHKLARACYHMLYEGTTFDLGRAFG
jgi:hypothetical protein